MRRVLAFVMMVAVAGCTLDDQKAPPLAGPSGLGLALTVSASPDILPQDGSSQSVIQVTATDDANQPVVGLSLKTEVRFELQVLTAQGCPGGTIDLGVIPGSPTLTQCLGLSGTTITTGGDGKASAVYSSPGFLGADVIATVAVTPVGSDFGSSQPRTVQIKLSLF
jgi:hypothetical protein